jgi:hypothetical protein
VRPVTVLRPGLLDGRAIALAGGPQPRIALTLSALGARVDEVDLSLGEDGVREWADGAAPLHALVYDARPAFGAGGQGGLQAALEQAWIATRGVATSALIPAGAGKVVLIAPRPRGGSLATATRAGLENLARTLSVEWARYGLTTVALAPGDRTTDEELAELAGFLVSPAGDYFSGCVLELGSYAPLSRPSRG